jgi:hypothetical protein
MTKDSHEELAEINAEMIELKERLAVKLNQQGEVRLRIYYDI